MQLYFKTTADTTVMLEAEKKKNYQITVGASLHLDFVQFKQKFLDLLYHLLEPVGEDNIQMRYLGADAS